MTTTEHVFQTDHQVKAAIVAELDWMPNIQADRIGVAINEGAVTLSGQVQTYPEKHAAVRAALRVRGVSAVADEIDIHNTWTPRNDTDIARDAGDVLKRTRMAPGGSVKAEVHDHVVILTGSVRWHYEREAIERAIAALPGVHGLTNAIALKPEAHVSPVLAETKIADALRRNAGVEAERIEVEVADDTIMLRGTVATWAERSQAGHAAWATPGVTHVQNDLHVAS